MDRGQEIRELKLGATFTNPNARTVYHTIKYDFKPASVDVHKEATLETGSNNSVTVTVPHLDGSGVPNTIFKGNQRDYTKKECVLIFNRETNEIILEKLSSNIQVKKTRTDSSNKQSSQQPPPIINTAKLENQTARHSSKTRVSTGIRKNVLNYVPKHSPLQNSPSYPHKSPQQAPAWNANNNTSTLPSITSLLDDNNFANQQQQPPQSSSSSSSLYNNSKNSNSNNNLSSSSSSTMLPKSSSNTMLSQQQQQQSQSHQMPVDDIGVLSSSEESSSDSNDDDSDSDSDDSVDSDMDNPPLPQQQHHHMMNNNSNLNMANHSNLNHKKAPTTSMGNHMDNSSKAALLTKDLCLSDSNSDSDY
ncbi:hypothetical protein PVAND_009254 [Polypedilum vanderplanki]|uniref:Ell-associated factor Eaf n=1 Tax=Polypedilum vanderplanki TaxID=319348 RepID=A0A9J6CCY1_POLVA|nr:hypothetical protein PVAND_009254 [Polypedilum vanderplanki]